MIQAAPLVLSFARAVPMLNRLVGAVGITELGDRVNNYIQENPEESAKIVSMIMPAQGIANALKNKSSEDVEEVEETEEVTTGSGVEERIREILKEAGVEDADNQDLTDLPKDLEAKVMSGIAKSSTNKQEDMKEASLIIGLRGPGKERKEMIDDVSDRYDEGGVEEVTRPKYEGYKKFIRRRRADGGAIGIEILFEDKKPRKNFFMGGPALTGQALNIYDSMNSYGFSDQEIANALSAQGLYGPGAAPVVKEGIISTVPNIINQGGRGGDGPPLGPTFNRNDLLGTTDYFPNPPLGHSLKMGLGSIVDFIKSGGIIGNTIRSFAKRFQKPRVELVNKINFDAVVREQERQKEVARQAAAEAAQQRDAAIASGLDAAIREGRDTSGFDRPDSGAYAEGAGMGVGGGYASDYGFKKGGLATMFTRKR